MSGTLVIFNLAYTPYKLKKGSTEKEIKSHAEKRIRYKGNVIDKRKTKKAVIQYD